MSSPDKVPHVGLLWTDSARWQAGSLYLSNLVKVLRPLVKSGDLRVTLIREEASLIAEFSSEITQVAVREFSHLENVDLKGASELREQRIAFNKRLWVRVLRKFFSIVRVPMPCRFRIPPAVTLENALFGIQRDLGVTFFYPLPEPFESVNGACWIPDLQHKFLPEYFSDKDIEGRDREFARMAEGQCLVFSSQSAKADFEQFWPGHAAALTVYRFRSILDPEVLDHDPDYVTASYHFPSHYFLVANQFWRHKDHLCIVKALIELASREIRPVVVFTGAVDDYRGRVHIDQFLQMVQKHGLHTQVRLLGFTSRSEQIALMRCAIAVVHPSRFEGWSTVVEDCRSIGQRLILSDLAVHREQDPENSLFFPIGDSVSLANAMELFLREPDAWLCSREGRESAGFEQSQVLQEEAGKQFLGIVRSRMSGG